MISIFTSSYNHGKFLPEAIESVLGQSFGDFEYLLYDDGSEDGSWEIIQKYAQQDARIRAWKLPKQANVGVVVNMSLQEYRGSVWVWCPSDDLLHQNLLSHKLRFSVDCPNAVLYSHADVINEQGKLVTKLRPIPHLPSIFRQVIRKQPGIGMTGIWIPRKVFERVGGFPEHLPYSEDFYWVLKACREGVDFLCVPEILYSKRVHPGRTTERHRQEIAANVQRIRDEVDA